MFDTFKTGDFKMMLFRYIYLEVEKFQGLVLKKLEDISFIKESEHTYWK